MVRFYACLYRNSSKMKYLYVVDDDRDSPYYDEFSDFCDQNTDLFDFKEIDYSQARYCYDQDISCIIW